MKAQKKRWWFAEVAMIEAIVLLALWLWSAYTAFIITLVGLLLVLSALAIAWVSEWLEPTRIPKEWFYMALLLAATALATGLLYGLLAGGWRDIWGDIAG
jgi:phosphoglycerol transferase MdoB-like AlkP superfamily enzyme